MKHEIDRLKNDLDTMQKAAGLSPGFGKEWFAWMKKDNWLNMWWCLPGAILVAAAFLPASSSTAKTWGLLNTQWVGVLVCMVLIGMLGYWRKITTDPARPVTILRDYKKLNTMSWWWTLGFLAQLGVFFAWAEMNQIRSAAIGSGIWMLSGSSLVIVALTTRMWPFMGWAVPCIGFGLAQPAFHLTGDRGTLGLGLVFIAGAVLSWVIQACQLKSMEKNHAAH